MGKTKPPYAPEFRAEAVRLIRRSGLTQSQVSRDLGVSTFTLRSRLQQAEIDSGERGGLTMDERDQLCRLRRENKVLREEREIAAEGGGAAPGHPFLDQLAHGLVHLHELVEADAALVAGLGAVRAADGAVEGGLGLTVAATELFPGTQVIVDYALPSGAFGGRRSCRARRSPAVSCSVSITRIGLASVPQ